MKMLGLKEKIQDHISGSKTLSSLLGKDLHKKEPSISSKYLPISLVQDLGEDEQMFYTEGNFVEHLFYQTARIFTVVIVAGLSRLWLRVVNTLYMKEDENYKYLLDAILSREKNVPLLTLSNHSSTLDDPTIFGATMPFTFHFEPRNVRWSVCEQSICHQTELLSTFFGLGKTLPILRGLGINQKPLLDYSRKLAAGQWGHIFPEGKVFQNGYLLGGDSLYYPSNFEIEGNLKYRRTQKGGEDKRNIVDENNINEYRTLKWGVGKLIAHAPVTPIIIPIWHTGMDKVVVLPDPNIPPEELTVLDFIPKSNQVCTVLVGEAIDVSDLIQDYENQYGALPRYTANPQHQVIDETISLKEKRMINIRQELDNWKILSGEPSRFKLYADITDRIEAEMVKLSCRAQQDRNKILKHIESDQHDVKGTLPERTGIEVDGISGGKEKEKEGKPLSIDTSLQSSKSATCAKVKPLPSAPPIEYTRLPFFW